MSFLESLGRAETLHRNTSRILRGETLVRKVSLISQGRTKKPGRPLNPASRDRQGDLTASAHIIINRQSQLIRPDPYYGMNPVSLESLAAIRGFCLSHWTGDSRARAGLAK